MDNFEMSLPEPEMRSQTFPSCVSDVYHLRRMEEKENKYLFMETVTNMNTEKNMNRLFQLEDNDKTSYTHFQSYNLFISKIQAFLTTFQTKVSPAKHSGTSFNPSTEAAAGEILWP